VGGMSLTAGQDFVVVTIPGVQAFIREARSTADVRAASEIVMVLAKRAAEACQSAGGELVFPSGTAGGGDGMPNRVVVLAPAGRGADIAVAAVAAVEREWDGWVRQALKLPRSAGGRPATPGVPATVWVCVPAGPGGYAEQWETARQLLDARRRIRDFAEVSLSGRALCSLSPRWPAEEPPPGLPEYERATLCAANWVKRRWRQIQKLDGFASTVSIASACYRREVLARLGDPPVRDAVAVLMESARQVMDERETRVPGLAEPAGDPGCWFARSGGPWVYQDRWQAESLARETKKDPGVIRRAVIRGADAAGDLVKLMRDRQVAAPASYLAVVVQDVDSMGKFLSGHGASRSGGRLSVAVAEHRRISGVLREVAGGQRRVLEGADVLGVPVYAGGDDLLAFVPAATALEAARACHVLIRPDLPTASTAVLFFHYHSGIQSAMAMARDLLKAAKAEVPGKHALAVGYRRRSGASEATIQPWEADGQTAAGRLGLFTVGPGYRLSPRLAADLERDDTELAGLHRRDRDLYRAELTRLVGRHLSRDRDAVAAGDTASLDQTAREVAEALAWLGDHEPSRPGEAAGARPVRAARVGVFLRQEAR